MRRVSIDHVTNEPDFVRYRVVIGESIDGAVPKPQASSALLAADLREKLIARGVSEPEIAEACRVLATLANLR